MSRTRMITIHKIAIQLAPLEQDYTPLQSLLLPQILPNGATAWIVNDQLHRDDGPAYIHSDVMMYYTNGVLQRRIFASGAEEWFADGKIHRDDGPALTHADGRKDYYLNGQRYCTVYANGSEEWYADGVLHRTDGPAIVTPNKHDWYLHGVKVTKLVNEWRKENKFPRWRQWTNTHKVMFRLAFAGTN